MSKKQWSVILAVVVGLCLAGYEIQQSLSKRAEQKRRMEYQRITKQYADALQVGTNRVEVENYIRTRGQQFIHMCCVGAPRYAWADLINIGKESAPWFCSRRNVYVAFEFEGAESRSTIGPKALDADKLLSVTLYERLEDCL